MAILSKRLMSQVRTAYHELYALRPAFMDILCSVASGADPLGALSNARQRRDFALQESINRGCPYVFRPCPITCTWVVALEDRRRIHGGMLGGDVRLDGSLDDGEAYLVSQGMERIAARGFLRSLPIWDETRTRQAGDHLQKVFYEMSGWQPVLMEENRLRIRQQQQINQAVEDQRRNGQPALYAFEKERVLLANIRAGDRGGARRILNEMLATIYLSSPQLVVLRARTVELMSCLTRAAIEDNPLMEPLIERNHTWTDRLINAGSFEELSEVLMQALDDFIDGIYLHGANRSNAKVHNALDLIAGNFSSRISLSSVAEAVRLSPGRLSHLVKEYTGRTVLQIIQEVRIRHAQHLLERTPLSCAEIAYEAGFGDQSYFTKHFRRLTGTTPARYRRSLRTR